MTLWTRRSGIVILLATALVLVGGFAGGAILSQDGPGIERSEGIEGSEGKTGHISQLSVDQVDVLEPEGYSVLYHFAGGLNNTVSAVHRATVVQCTNVDEIEPTGIELQLFQYNATSVYTGTISIDPMDTATFESSSVEFYAADVVMGAGFVEQGYGRILAEHKNVICSVQTLDPDNIPPAWGFDIPVYAGPYYANFVPAILRSTGN